MQTGQILSAISKQYIQIKHSIKIHCIHFVDYEKAFDSVEHSAVFHSLWEQGINENYIKVIENVYNNWSAAIIPVDNNSNKIIIKKIVKQSVRNLSKLFSAGLERIFRNMNW